MKKIDFSEQAALPAMVQRAVVDLGWSIIPVGQNKKPLVSSWKEFQEKGATLEGISKWQEELGPAAWAVVTGQVSDIIVLDLDGVPGSRTLKKLGLNPHVKTPSGGFHQYFKHPGWRVATLNGKAKRDLGEKYPGLDIRADGGYAIFYGQNSTGTYQWLREPKPDSLELLPKDLRDFLGLEVASPSAISVPSSDIAASTAASLPQIEVLIDEALEMAAVGGRNNSGFWLAMQLRDLGYGIDAAERVMERYVDRAPRTNPRGEAEAYTRDEAIASLQQAFSQEPRTKTDRLYFATETGMFWRKTGRDGTTVVPLTNFRAEVVEDVLTDDGVESQRKFGIVAQLNGRKKSITIPAREFPSMNWVYEMLGPEAVIFAGNGVKDHTRTAIQMISQRIVSSRVYAHTGWRKIASSWYYLHSGGAIGVEGTFEVKVALPPDFAPFELPPPPSGSALRKAVRASVGILNLGPRQITVPLYCGIWRSVLGTCDFSIHLAGPTGTFKTSVAALAQQHFGAKFDRLRPGASWESTENALQALQFSMKDAILLIDDFAPRGNKSDVERYHQKADRVLRGQGNNSGRARMKPDSSLRSTKTARGTTLSTGEDTPKGESLKARLMILELERGTIDEDRLKLCQERGSNGLYAQAMSAFLNWLAPRYDEISAEMPGKIAELRAAAANSNQHKRTPEMIAHLMYGLNVFLRFCRDKQIVPDEYSERVRDVAWKALGQAAKLQAGEQRADEPAQRFLDLLSAALSSGDAYLGNVRAEISIRKSGRCIGWIDENFILLEPDASFAEAQRMASIQGEGLPLAKHTLWKRLNEKGFVARREVGRNLLRWPALGNNRRVLCLRATALATTRSEE